MDDINISFDVHKQKFSLSCKVKEFYQEFMVKIPAVWVGFSKLVACVQNDVLLLETQ